MDRVLSVINSRSAQVVALSAALLVVLREFGVPLTAVQEDAVTGFLFALIAVLAGRDISTARALPPKE